VTRFRSLHGPLVRSVLSVFVLLSLLPISWVAAQNPPSAPDGIYTPGTDREIYQRIASDYQLIVQLTNQIDEGLPLPVDEILQVYENARIAVIGTGTRPMRGFAREDARATEFPEAAAYYGSPTFLDDPVIDAIQGTGTAAGYTESQRREAIQKGLLRIIYYWSARYVDQTRTNLNPGLVDEAWAIYMGTRVGESYPNSLSAAAVTRETLLSRPGSIDVPLRQAMARGQQAAAAQDAAAYNAAADEVHSRFNAIFYLSTARHFNVIWESAQTGNPGRTAVLQVEGLSYYRTIQPKVALADPAADQAIVAYFNAAPDSLTLVARDEALDALNRAFDALMLLPSDRVTPATFS
jgi:hypothetical protein